MQMLSAQLWLITTEDSDLRSLGDEYARRADRLGWRELLTSSTTTRFASRSRYCLTPQRAASERVSGPAAGIGAGRGPVSALIDSD